MKFRTKVAIFLVAVFVTVMGFSLIASPAIEMMKVGKDAGYEMISNYLAKADAQQSRSIIG
jgi:hypothetical protein